MVLTIMGFVKEASPPTSLIVTIRPLAVVSMVDKSTTEFVKLGREVSTRTTEVLAVTIFTDIPLYLSGIASLMYDSNPDFGFPRKGRSTLRKQTSDFLHFSGGKFDSLVQLRGSSAANPNHVRKVKGKYRGDKQMNANNFIVNIVPLANIQTNASGLEGTAVLANQIAQLQEMVDYDLKRINADSYSNFTADTQMTFYNLATSETTTTTAATSTLTTSTIYVNNFVNLSDLVTKTDVRDVFETPSQLSGISTILLISTHMYQKGNVSTIGFLTDQLENVCSSFVIRKDVGKFVDNNAILAVLVKAVQELSKNG